MSKPTLVMKYKGWNILQNDVRYDAVRKSSEGQLCGVKYGFLSISAAKRWIGRNVALASGKGKRQPKPKTPTTKGIRIKHTCIKPENRTFARFRFSKVRDSITYINRTYNNCAKSAIDDIIVDCADKAEDWFDKLPESYTCPTCHFSITKAEIMNTYLFRKMGDN